MSTTLEVILKTAGFNEGATAIKKVGDEATNTNNKLKTTTSTVDQVSKSTTSLGSKLANAGKQFSGTITNIAALGSTVVNLSRQYQDLTDSQIRVDRSSLKVSKTTEAVGKAQAKLSALMAKGITSGQAYEAAQLDIKQALEAQDLATRNLTEATEDHQRAQENFWMGLAPTILTAGSSVTSALKEIGGTKGIGGLTSKLSSFTGTLGISTKALVGMAGALSVAAIGIADIIDLLKQADQYKAAQAHIVTGKATVDELKTQVDATNALMDRIDVRFWDFMKGGPLGKAIFGPTTKDVGTEVIKSLESEIDRKGAIKAWQDILVGIISDPQVSKATKDSVQKQITYIQTVLGNESNWKAGYGNTAEAVRANTLSILGPAIDAAAADIKAGALEGNFRRFGLATAEGLTGAMRDEWLKVNKGGEFFGVAPQTALFAANPRAINTSSTGPLTMGVQMKKAQEGTHLLTSEIAALTKESLKNASGSNTQKAATDALSKAEAGLAQHTKDVAAAKVAAAAAARDLATAGDNELSGINKIIAAYAELEPTVTKMGKGHVTKGVQKLPIQQAQDALKTFMQGLAPTLTTGSAEKFATDWINTAAKKIGGGASMILKPLIDYITQHKNDAPGVFASGLVDVIGSLDLTKNMQKVYLPVTAESAAAAKEAGANLGKIDTAPAVTKISTVEKALKNIPPQYKTTVTVIDKASGPAKQIKNALASIPKLTTATIKIIPKYLGTPLGNQLISGNLKLKQHGYQSTVHRPTMFMAGEGGRPEDVTVRPRGSVQRGGAGGGGFYGTVNVYVDGVLRPARYSMGARK